MTARTTSTGQTGRRPGQGDAQALERRQQVAVLHAKGYSNAAIARELDCARETVATDLKLIRAAYGEESRRVASWVNELRVQLLHSAKLALAASWRVHDLSAPVLATAAESGDEKRVAGIGAVLLGAISRIAELGKRVAEQADVVEAGGLVHHLTALQEQVGHQDEALLELRRRLDEQDAALRQAQTRVYVNPAPSAAPVPANGHATTTAATGAAAGAAVPAAR